jgi:hypothetical protein
MHHVIQVVIKGNREYGREHRKGYQVTMVWSVREVNTFTKIHV